MQQRFLEGCLCFRFILLDLFHLCSLPKYCPQTGKCMQFQKKNNRRICRYDEARSLIIPVPQFCQLLKDGDKGCWHQWTVVLTPVDLLPMRNGPDRRLQPKHFEECTVHPKKNLKEAFSHRPKKSPNPRLHPYTGARCLLS